MWRQVCRGHLQDLTLDKVRDDGSHELKDLLRSKATEGSRGAGEEKVTAEHRELASERGGCRGGTATERRRVDHVVVQERGDVDHLAYLGEPQLGREESVRERWDVGRGRGRRWGGMGGPWGRAQVKGDTEGGGVVWHGRVEVAEHVGAGEGSVELVCGEAAVLGGPRPDGKAGAQAVGRAGEEQDEEGSYLLGGLAEVVGRDLGERRMGRAKQRAELGSDACQLGGKERMRVDGRRRRGERRTASGRLLGESPTRQRRCCRRAQPRPRHAHKPKRPKPFLYLFSFLYSTIPLSSSDPPWRRPRTLRSTLRPEARLPPRRRRPRSLHPPPILAHGRCEKPRQSVCLSPGLESVQTDESSREIVHLGAHRLPHRVDRAVQRQQQQRRVSLLWSHLYRQHEDTPELDRSSQS